MLPRTKHGAEIRRMARASAQRLIIALNTESDVFRLTQRINDAHELLDIMGAPTMVAPDCDSKLTLRGRLEWVRENYKRI